MVQKVQSSVESSNERNLLTSNKSMKLWLKSKTSPEEDEVPGFCFPHKCSFVCDSPLTTPLEFHQPSKGNSSVKDGPQSSLLLPDHFILEQRFNGLTNDGNSCYIISLFRLLSSTYFKVLFVANDLLHAENFPQCDSANQLLCVMYKDWIQDIKPRNNALFLSNFIPYVQCKLNFGTAQHDISDLFYPVIGKIDAERRFICPGDIMTINCVDFFECLNTQCQYRGPAEASLAIFVKFDSDFNFALDHLIISQQRKQFNPDHECTQCFKTGVYRSRHYTSVSKYLNVYVRRVLFHGLHGIKKQNVVEFEEKLNIPVTLQNGLTIYKSFTLIGFIIHIGSQASSGHYVCFVKSNNQWMLHDDSKVSRVKRECVFREYTYKNVYLLTYSLD